MDAFTRRIDPEDSFDVGDDLSNSFDLTSSSMSSSSSSSLSFGAHLPPPGGDQTTHGYADVSSAAADSSRRQQQPAEMTSSEQQQQQPPESKYRRRPLYEGKMSMHLYIRLRSHHYIGIFNAAARWFFFELKFDSVCNLKVYIYTDLNAKTCLVHQSVQKNASVR